MRKQKNVLALGFTSFFNDIGSEMIFPILPLFITSALGAPVMLLGLIEGIAGFTASILKLFSGMLSDKLGKRKMLVSFGYGLSALTKPFFAAAGAWSDVLFVRFVDRIGKGIRDAPRDALLAASVRRRIRGGAFGLRQALDTSGAIIGALLAAWLLSIAFSYRAIFLLAFIPSFVSVLIISFFVKEISHAPIKGPMLPKLKLGKKLKVFLMIVGIFNIANFSYAFFLLRAQHLGLEVFLIPVVYLIYNIMYALLAFPAGRLSDTIGRKKVIFTGYALFALTAACMAYINDPLFLWPLFGLYGIQIALTDSVSRAYIADMVPDIKRASAIGAYHMVIGLAAFPASFLAGVIWDIVSPEATFLFAATIAALAGLFLAIFRG